jgi:hypothetical protein
MTLTPDALKSMTLLTKSSIEVFSEPNCLQTHFSGPLLSEQLFLEPQFA